MARGTRDPQGQAPLLVLRFALLSAVGLALAAAAILMLVRHFSTAQAERAATRQAEFTTRAILADSLSADDFAGTVDGARRAELDELFQRQVLDDHVLRVELIAADGTIAYATDHRLIGIRTPEVGRIHEVTSGSLVSDVTSVYGLAGMAEDVKVLRAYTPLAFEDQRLPGVVAIYQDYAPIAAVAREAFFPIAGVLEVALLLLYVALIPALRRVSSRIRRQVEQIEFQALHDDLTGLPNRTLFRLAIQAAARRGGQFGVLLLDLDRFKEINDALGHQVGDDLLRELGARLGEALADEQTVARLGGDEFGIVLPRATPVYASEVAQYILALLSEPVALRDMTLEVSASIGIALAPEHGNDADTLIRHADVAMYLAKDAHAGARFYDETVDPNEADRLTVVAELRRAIHSDELVLHYQPKADLATGQLVGVEALVRWNHPRRGLMRPHEFLPVAERTGLIKPLSGWVLDTALRQCAEWNASGADVHVAVNLTVANLLDAELPEEVAALLERYELEADSLEVEITESMIMVDPVRVRQVLLRLSEMGVRLAIDDFGTGYSSLAYLKQLPVDVLKIDKSFVMHMTESESDSMIVKSTIDLARNLGLEAVAEGIESAETWDALRAAGCHVGQGYHIGRPVAARAISEMLGGSTESELDETDRRPRLRLVAEAA